MNRQAPLAMDAAEFKRLGHQLIDQLAEAMASVPAGPVMRNESPTSVRRALDLEGPLPEHGTDAATIFKDLTPRLFEHSLFNAHPRFFGYITAPPAPIGISWRAGARMARRVAWVRPERWDRRVRRGCRGWRVSRDLPARRA